MKRHVRSLLEAFISSLIQEPNFDTICFPAPARGPSIQLCTGKWEKSDRIPVARPSACSHLVNVGEQLFSFAEQSVLRISEQGGKFVYKVNKLEGEKIVIIVLLLTSKFCSFFLFLFLFIFLFFNFFIF